MGKLSRMIAITIPYGIEKLELADRKKVRHRHRQQWINLKDHQKGTATCN